MSFWDDLGSAGKYLIDTGAKLYTSTLDAKTTQKANEAGAEIAKEKAKDTITVGGYEISIVKTLAITAGAAAFLLLFTLINKRR